jgi:hypothetical protein
MSNIIRGYQGAVFQGARRNYRPGIGWTTSSRYACPDIATAQGLAGANAGGQLHVDLDDAGPPYIVEIGSPDDGTNDPQQDVEISTYELTAIDETPDIFESELFRGISNEDHKNAVRLYRNSAQSQDDWDALIDPTFGAGTGNDAYTVAELIRNGQDSFYAAKTEFRWTRTVSDSILPTSSAQAFDSVAKIFTTDKLNSSVAPPAAWQVAIVNSAENIAAAGTGYAVGWLKYQPTITRKGLNKNEISLRWILNTWNTALYGSAV